VVNIFNHYLDQQGIRITRAQFEENLLEKASSQTFVDDIRPLLSPAIESQWSLEEALTMMQERVFPSLAGAAWKGENPVQA
jgi:hypothetical protein